MTTILILLGIFFGIVLFFCRNIRQSVMNRLATAGYYIAGKWNNIINSAGETNWKIVRTILWIALAALIVPLIIALLFVIILAIVIAKIGLATGSTWVSIPFGITFVIWFIFYQIPRALNRLPIYGRLIQLTRWVTGTVALVCFVPLVMGIVIPNVKAAMIRSSWNQEQKVANKINEGSVHSEPETGIIRKIKEDIYAIPDIPGKEPFFIKTGDMVKVLGWDTNRKANDRREGLVKVMAKNKFGHYDGGQEGWIPIRVLEEGSPNITTSPPPANVPAASAVPGENWKLCWKKPEGYAGNSNLRSLCGVMEIKKKDRHTLVAIFQTEYGPSTFTGSSLNGKEYQGLWEDRTYSGEFFLDFLSEDSAMGHSTDKGSKIKKEILATKI